MDINIPMTIDVFTVSGALVQTKFDTSHLNFNPQPLEGAILHCPTQPSLFHNIKGGGGEMVT